MLRRTASLLCLVSLLACAHTSAATSGAAGPEADEARAAVDGLFAAMNAHDATALRGHFLEGAVIIHVGEQPDGSVRHGLVTAEEFIASTEQAPPNIVERFTRPPVVRVDGPIATVWGPYELLVDGQPHHCGVDAIQLARLDGRWKVTAITYTARACE